jgi:hypothetical protein
MAVAANLLQSSAETGQDHHPEGLMCLLQQAARMIDSMWRTAQADSPNSTMIALGEASHGVHRALIALQSEDAGTSTPDPG